MYRIQLRYGKERQFYGTPIESLEDIHDFLLKMEEDWIILAERGFPGGGPLRFLEFSETYVVGDDGSEYILDENSVLQRIN